MEIYNSIMYGAYYISKFMIELNRTVVTRGDFHRYIASDITGYILNPRSTCEDAVHIFSVGDIIDEIPKNRNNILKSMYTIFHETTHLVQDFTLGSEILRDILYDNICAKSFEKRGVQVPLSLRQLQDYNIDKDIITQQKIYDKIYKGFIKVNMGNNEFIKIGTTDLVEAYALAKAFYYMIQAEPESVKDNKMNIDFHNSNERDIYKKAWSVFAKTLAFVKEPYMGGSLCREQLLDMIGFLFICDIALHIPVTVLELSTDRCPGYTLPYIRFMCIVETLIQNKGYPDAIEGEDFYVTLFDFIARCNGWPTFQETNDGWCFFLGKFMERGFMVSDGYRMFGLEYKKNNANKVVCEPPGIFLRENYIPVLVRYYKRNDSFFEYVCLNHIGNLVYMDSSPINPLRDPYEIMKQEVFCNTWNAESFFDEISKKTGSLWPLQTHPAFLREIFCRIISKEFCSAVKENTPFFCPLVNLRCLSKTDSCCCLNNFTKLPEHCCLAIWMKDSGIKPDSVYLEVVSTDFKQIKKLEQEVYNALKQDFFIETDNYNDSLKNFCTIPPGILMEILETLVIPVVTALASEFLIQKFMPEKDNHSERIWQNAKILKERAEKEIDSRGEEILEEYQTSGNVVQKVSTKVMLNLNITVNSPEDGEMLLSYLQKYLNGPEDSQGYNNEE